MNKRSSELSQWKRYVGGEGAYSVELPGRCETMMKNVAGDGGGFVASTEREGYLVMEFFVDWFDRQHMSGLELQAAEYELMKSIIDLKDHGKIHTIQLGKFRGMNSLQFESTVSHQSFRKGLLFCSGEQGYYLLIDSDDAHFSRFERFINSFKLLKKTGTERKRSER